MQESAEPKWPFVGTWRLVSYESRDEAGRVAYPLGRDALGQLWYDADGNMCALLARATVPRFASDDFRGGTDAELRGAFDGFAAYFGTYGFDLAAGTVTHYVRGSSFPNWAGGGQVRHFRAEGQRLVLATPPISIDGRRVTAALVWERASGT